MGWLDHMIGVCLTCEETAKLPKWSYHLIPPPAMCEIPFPMLGMVSLFSFGHSNRCRASFHVFIAIHIFFGKLHGEIFYSFLNGVHFIITEFW